MTISNRALVACATSFALLLSACGSSSDPSTTDLAVKGPSIVTQPATAAIAAGFNSVLSVVAIGSTLTYQWFQDGAAIAGATAATYTATAAATYYVVVTAADGAITSANAVITLTSAPVITAQPMAITILAGSSQLMAVTASGANLAYQWYKDGVAIADATHASYAASAAGSYTVVVNNAGGSVTSAAAAVAVSSSVSVPVIGVQPAALTVNGGTAATFSVVASGTSLAYQWFLNDTAIPGATERVYKITTTNANSAGNYAVAVSNSAGSVTSARVGLSVNLASAGANTPAVVNAANAFLATLSATQKTVATSATASTTVLFDYALANAIQWTNLPGDRHGLRLNTSTLSAAQLAAANTVIAKALGATGITLMNELRAADQVLAAAPATGMGGGGMTGTMPTDGTGVPPTGTIGAGGTPPTGATGTPPTDTGAGGTGTAAGGVAALGYGADLYSIAFVGTPSATSPWILQLAGHHLAYNITYNTGKVSATPNFIGVEPPNWTVAADGTVTVTSKPTSAGVAHAPLESQRAAVYNLAESLYANATTNSGARLAGTFTDVVMGASGNSDGNFKTLAYPTSGRGLQYTAMSFAQRAYVCAAIEAWVNTQAAGVASTLLGDYLADTALANTWVGYGVGQNGTKADFSAYPNSVSSPLEAQRSYIRIDGPRVWIEFVVQQGVLYSTDVHYHSIWRDKTNDYGGSF